jgi:hypothetical protein
MNKLVQIQTAINRLRATLTDYPARPTQAGLAAPSAPPEIEHGIPAQRVLVLDELRKMEGQ